MIKCQYCDLIFTAASQVTADNAYILHVMKEHKDTKKATLPTIQERKFKITCLKCNSDDCTYFIHTYDSTSEMGVECKSCGNKESSWT